MPDAWLRLLKDDPRPWLLEESNPAVRAATLVRLLGRSAADPEVVAARAQALQVDPIKGILDAMDPRGFWVKPGPGYAPKYSGTVWNLMFLEQMGADPADERVQAACRYVLDHTTVATGGFGCSGSHLERNPPPSSVLHCLNGNLTRALVAFGHLDDPRVQAAVDWAARTITGEGVDRWYAYTPGPGFACGINEDLPCAWGAAKDDARPRRHPAPPAHRPGEAGHRHSGWSSCCPATRPMPTTPWAGATPGRRPPGSSWASPRDTWPTCSRCSRRSPNWATAGTPAWSPPWPGWPAGRTPEGRWANRYAYHGKTTVPIEAQGKPSKWVTLRACTVLRAAG